MVQSFRQLVKRSITMEYFTVSLCKKFWSGNASVPFIPKPVELEKDVISALFFLTGKPAIVQHKYSGPAALNSSFRYSVTIMTRLKYDKIHWHVERAAIITVWLHWTKRRTRSVWCSTRTNKQTNKQETASGYRVGTEIFRLFPQHYIIPLTKKHMYKIHSQQ